MVASWILRINLASSRLLSSSDERVTLFFSDTGGDEDKSNEDLLEKSPLEDVKSNDGKMKKFGRSDSKLNEALISFNLGAVQISLGMWWSLLFDTSSTTSIGSLNKESGRKSNLCRSYALIFFILVWKENFICAQYLLSCNKSSSRSGQL